MYGRMFENVQYDSTQWYKLIDLVWFLASVFKDDYLIYDPFVDPIPTKR